MAVREMEDTFWSPIKKIRILGPSQPKRAVKGNIPSGYRYVLDHKDHATYRHWYFVVGLLI
jgi:hypothetical protein